MLIGHVISLIDYLESPHFQFRTKRESKNFTFKLSNCLTYNF